MLSPELLRLTAATFGWFRISLWEKTTSWTLAVMPLPSYESSRQIWWVKQVKNLFIFYDINLSTFSVVNTNLFSWWKRPIFSSEVQSVTVPPRFNRASAVSLASFPCRRNRVGLLGAVSLYCEFALRSIKILVANKHFEHKPGALAMRRELSNLLWKRSLSP